MTSNLGRKNTFLNILIIFLLVVLILFGVNIYYKLTHTEKNDPIDYTKSTGKIIQVEILNATDTKGLAEKFAKYLKEKKFDVVRTGNYGKGIVDESFLIDRYGNEQIAKIVAKELGIEDNKIKRLIVPDSLLDVSVVIGKDFKKLNSE